MIGAFIGAAGAIIGGVKQSKAASSAANAASKDRMESVRLGQDDYRNNMAQRDRDQADLDAMSDDMQRKYDAARQSDQDRADYYRDFDQNRNDAYRDNDQRRSDAYRDFDQSRNDAYRDRDQMAADALAQADQLRAIEYARSDEARMVAAHREAVGYDLGRLVADAQAAGFNPLTVLGATGGAAYAREAAPVVTTPFVAKQLIGSTVVGSNRVGSTVAGSTAIGSRVAERQFAPRPMIDTAGIFGGASGAVAGARADRVQSAGYIGDTISGLGAAYTGYSAEQARLASDRDLAEAIRNGGSAGRAVGGSARQAGAIMEARTVDARPVGNTPSAGMIGPRLPSQAGPSANDILFGGRRWAHAPDTSTADDVENVYGDSELVSTGAALAIGGRDIVYNYNLARRGATSSAMGRAMRQVGSWLTPAPGGPGDMMSVGP